MKKDVFIAAFILMGLTVFAQEQKAKEEFKASGKPLVTIFSDFHTGLKTAGDETGFGLKRVYFGYQYQLSKALSGKVVFDIGSSGISGSSLERFAYVKNALISWKLENFSLNAGLIGMELFNVQEKFWGYRYIRKSFQDEYKYGHSADMGVSGKFDLSKKLSLNVVISNGEGYKKLNVDNSFRYGGGITITPISTLTLRAYYDRYDKSVDNLTGKTQQNLALFVGHKNKNFSLGLEYNNMLNATFQDGKNQYGLSAYSTVKLPKNFEIFGRFDYAASNNDWNIAKDEQVALLGFQYAPISSVRIAPNIKAVFPKTGTTLIYGAISLLVSI